MNRTVTIILSISCVFGCTPSEYCLQINNNYENYDKTLADFTYYFLKQQQLLDNKYIFYGYHALEPDTIYINQLKHLLSETHEMRVCDLSKPLFFEDLPTTEDILMIQYPKINKLNKNNNEMSFSIAYQYYYNRLIRKPDLQLLYDKVSYWGGTTYFLGFHVKTNNNEITTFCYDPSESHMMLH